MTGGVNKEVEELYFKLSLIAIIWIPHWRATQSVNMNSPGLTFNCDLKVTGIQTKWNIASAHTTIGTVD